MNPSLALRAGKCINQGLRTMNFKTTYILFGILAVVLGIFIYTMMVGPSPSDASAWVLPSMHNEASPLTDRDIDRVEIERHRPNEEKIVLVKEGDNWRITEPRDYRADRTTVEDLVRQIYDAKKAKDSDIKNNPAQYGLDTPAAVITLKKESQPPRQVTLQVGNTSAGDATAVIYVSSSDRPKEILAVSKRSLDKSLSTLNDLRSRDLLSPASSDIQAFTLTQRSKDKVAKGPVELKKGSEDRWTYVQPDYGDASGSGADTPGVEKAPGNVQTILTEISNLRVESSKDFVQDDAQDLAKYNLDPTKDDVLRLDIDRAQESSTEGNKEKKTAKVSLLVGVGKKVGDKSDQYYAYLDDAKHKDIVRIPASKIEPFIKLLDKPDALRDRNLIALRGQADAIDLKNSWGLLEFRRSSASPAEQFGQKPWKLWRGDKSYAVDDTAMQGLIGALTAQNQVESFPDPGMKAQLGLDKPDAVLSIWADSLPAEDKKDDKKDEKKDDKKEEKKEEKKDKKPEPKDKSKPAYVLSFGYRRENSVAVERKRGDEKTGTIVLVPAKLLDQVREGPLAYLDKQLPPYSATRFDAVTNVTKLELTRDGTTYEISRENKPDAAWKFTKPADFAGRTADRVAVEAILTDLNSLHAVKIVDDKIPEAGKLREWGLQEPRLKAVVTLTVDNKPKTFTYDIGKEADDKSGSYLRASQQDMISIIGDNVVKDLQRELQDPAVFHFDPPRVKSVKLTGWIDLQKKRGLDQPDVLEVKRDNGTDWVVETPKGFKLDAGKLNDFLRELSNLKAMKFVSHKTPPSAAQGLDVAKEGALKIELTLDNEKEPLVLTVGNVDGNTAYFATSNKLTGDIFDVRKELFEKVKDGPGYFSKQ
jgi:hypothetical protein